VPKVQFLFKVVDAGNDACHRSLKGPRLAGIQTRFSSSIQFELPVAIPASRPTNELLQLGNFSSL